LDFSRGAVAYVSDTGRAAVIDQDPVDERAIHHVEVGTRAGRSHMGDERAHADLVAPVLGPRPDHPAPRIGRVDVRHRSEPKLGEPLGESMLNRLPRFRVVGTDRDLRLDALIVTDYVVPAPAVS